MSEEIKPIRVRALTQLYHNSRMYKPGDEFDYVGKLTGHPAEGMEEITDDSTQAFEAARQAQIKQADAKAKSLRAHHAKLVKQAQDKPGQVALAQKVIEADAAAEEAERAAEDLKGEHNDLV
jgi:hypothetical protein